MNTVELKCVQTFYNDGQIEREEYRLNGELHNPNGPASRTWYENGEIKCEEYWLNGKLHDPNGPAYRSWYENGQIRCEEYWLNGVEFAKSEWEKKVNPTPSFNGKII